MSDAADEEEAPGWHAIDTALESLYGDQKPRNWGTILPAALGGSDYLQGVSCYLAEEPPHWHFVTYGFSELYAKEGEDLETSGFGFELTLRLPRRGESEPPAWCFNFFQNLARYVFTTGNGLEPGHYLDANGPLVHGSGTALGAVVFLEDPQLRSISTVNGRVQFLQAVGVTLDELQAVKEWNAAEFLEVLESRIPLALTDVERSSILLDPSVRDTVASGIARDGSSTSVLFIRNLSWRQQQHLLRGLWTTIVIGANGVRDLAALLRSRIPFGRPLSVAAESGVVTFVPAERFAVAVETADGSRALRVELTAEHAHRLAATLLPQEGTYSDPLLPKLAVVVERSAILNPDGSVGATVG